MSENVTVNISQPTEKITVTMVDQGEKITINLNEQARGPAGSDANVTNANVNTAIESNPSATRDSLDLGTAALADTGTGASNVILGNDARLTDARTPTSHASSHVTGGTDKIRDASASQDGLMTTTYAAKLNGIEAGADVTDATNVNAAGAVMESDYTPSHSLLVQQSGTGSPSSLSVGNNTLVGRLSGGGSDIDDLSASQVRTLLNVEDGADVTDAVNVASTITGATEETTPVDGDFLPMTKTSASGALRKVTFANMFAYVLTKLQAAASIVFTGQLRSTNQTAATSDALMTRDLVGNEPFFNLGRSFRHLSTPSFANSGTTGANAFQSTGGDRWISLTSGTANSGWARATIGRGITTVPIITGAGISFSRPQGVALCGFIATSAFTDINNIFRIRYGSNNTPALDGVDAVAYRGFGVEIKNRGSSRDWRVYGHNGSVISYSAWTNTGLTADILSLRLYISVISNGAGLITASLGSQGNRTISQITTTGGPTTVGTSAESFIECHVANSSSGTSALVAVFLDHQFYAE
jgi:hypothetical protein